MIVKFSLLLSALAFLSETGRASDVVLDEKLIDLSRRTMELAAELQKDDPLVPGGIVYIDEPDSALFLREDNYCFAIFRGTTPNIVDWLQNLNPFTGRVCSTKHGDCCTTRLGFQQAYELPYYKDELESNVRLCKDECKDCQVIFAGHSQGGAIASIAAIAMDDMDPTILAFGQPGSIIGDCPSINTDNYYRFVNTVLDGRNVNYDPVPYLNLNSDHRGHLFVMGSDDQNVVYYPNGSGPSTFEFGWQVPAHALPKYIERMDVFRNNAPLNTEGWRLGYACSVDEECVAPKHCVDRQCHEGVNGDPCKDNNDCDSGRCMGFLASVFTGTCRAKLESGRACAFHADCESNTCSWFTCA